MKADVLWPTEHVLHCIIKHDLLQWFTSLLLQCIVKSVLCSVIGFIMQMPRHFKTAKLRVKPSVLYKVTLQIR